MYTRTYIHTYINVNILLYIYPYLRIYMYMYMYITYICTCIFILIHVYIFIRIYIYIHTCTYVNMHIQTCMCIQRGVPFAMHWDIYACIHMYMSKCIWYIRRCIYMYIYTYIYSQELCAPQPCTGTYVHTYTCIYINIYIYISVHIYIYTYMAEGSVRRSHALGQPVGRLPQRTSPARTCALRRTPLTRYTMGSQGSQTQLDDPGNRDTLDCTVTKNIPGSSTNAARVGVGGEGRVRGGGGVPYKGRGGGDPRR